MDGVWLVSYIALWLVVVGLAMVTLLILREIGQRYLNSPDAVELGGVDLGKEAPPFSLEDVDGSEHSVGAIGVPTLLIFASSICHPCKLLIPDLNRFLRETDSRIRTLLLVGGSAEGVIDFREETHADVPTLHDNAGQIAGLYRVTVSPFAFMIDGQGKIVNKGVPNGYDKLKELVSNNTAELGVQELQEMASSP